MLIDYRDSDLNILSLFSQKMGKIFVPNLIANEVKGCSQEQFQAIGLNIYEPEVSELLIAYSYRGGLSAQDYLCLILAQKYEWCCVTNEKLLRNECERNNIKTIRGLRLLIELCRAGFISPQHAESTALNIQKVNHLHITNEIIDSLRSEIGLKKPDYSSIGAPAPDTPARRANVIGQIPKE